jgi:hypothetical protein
MEWVYIYLTLVRNVPVISVGKTTTRQSRNANSLMRVERKTILVRPT